MSTTRTQHELDPRHTASEEWWVRWRIAESDSRATFLDIRVAGDRLEAALHAHDRSPRPVGTWHGVEVRRDSALTHIDLEGKFRATFRGGAPIYARTDLLRSLGIAGGRAELVATA